MREQMTYNPRFFQLREQQLERMLAIVRQTRDARPGGVVFFGDSLTEIYPIERCYPELALKYNCGIAGSVSEELLWMADEGVIKYRPRLVVLMVGTNDLGNTVMASPREIALHVRDLVDLIRGNCPDAKVFLWSPLPCIEEINGYRQGSGIRSNDLLRMIFAQERELIRDDAVAFVDAFPAFIDEQGRTRAEFYRDGLHLNDEGFDRLTGVLAPTIHHLLGMA